MPQPDLAKLHIAELLHQKYYLMSKSSYIILFFV